MATLQEAINATRNGNNIEAQKILADILKSDTENTHAWYLLSLLVDSPEKKDAYLNRVLTLDPNHEKAKAALSSSSSLPSSPLIESEPVIEGDTAVSPTATFEDPSNFSGDSMDSSLPSWLEADNLDVSEDMLVEEEPSEIFNSELPDWLSTESSAINVLDEPPTVPSAIPPKDLSKTVDHDEKIEQPLQQLEDSLDNSEELAVSSSPPTASSMASTRSEPTPSVIGWNLILFILSLLAIFTLIGIALQLNNLF